MSDQGLRIRAARVFGVLASAAAVYVVALALAAAWSAGSVKRHQIESAAFILAALWAAGVATLPVSDRGARDTFSPRFRLACGLAALVGAASMWRAVLVGPLSDDYVIESWARAGQLLGGGGWFARPLVVGLWQVVLRAGGGTGVLHAVNLLLHAANSLLVVALARRLGTERLAAAVAGAVFLCWPTQIEPVFWTSGMFDVAMTTFVLAALILTAPELPASTRGAGVLCGGAALLSKETAVVLPVLWLVCYVPRRPDVAVGARRLVLVTATLTLLCAAYFGWRAWLGLPVTTGKQLTRYVLKEHLSRTFGGLGLPLMADTVTAHPLLAVLLAILFLCMLVALVWGVGDGSQRTAAQGLAWAIVATAPTIGLLFIGPDLDGSRYLYLPGAGWGLFVGAGVARLARGRGPARACVLVIAIVASVIVLVERRRLAEQWVLAGQQRDAILAAAVTAASSGCDQVTFSDLPARYRGAQLFNNGFPEAFARVRAPATGTRACRFEWTARGFEAR